MRRQSIKPTKLVSMLTRLLAIIEMCSALLCCLMQCDCGCQSLVWQQLQPVPTKDFSSTTAAAQNWSLAISLVCQLRQESYFWHLLAHDTLERSTYQLERKHVAATQIWLCK